MKTTKEQRDNMRLRLVDLNIWIDGFRPEALAALLDDIAELQAEVERLRGSHCEGCWDELGHRVKDCTGVK